MGEEVLAESARKQAEMETSLLRILTQGFPETRTVEEVFGPYERWLLPVGTHLLLLHPVLREWLVLDRLHDTWERTGFGPGEAVFVAHEKRLGFRRRKSTPEIGSQSPDQGTPERAGGDPITTRLCASCRARVGPGCKFCSQCGARLR